MRQALVIGAGIAGCSAALELARLGTRVTVLESSSRVGGKVLSYCCKAADSCSRCGACVAHERILEAIRHPRIRFITSASIGSVRRRNGGFSVVGSAALPSVDLRRCTDCGACIQACPAGCIDRYGRGGLVQYEIDSSRCIRTCTKCGTACSASAIRTGAASAFKVEAGAVLVAIGHEAYDPTRKPRLGYGRIPGVYTGLEAEEALSKGGFPGGPRRVAFIQCVGSRDPKSGRNYCSAVCCAYALRMARRLAGRDPGVKADIYCVDVQNFDKAFTHFRRELGDSGIRIIHGVPSAVTAAPDRGLSLWMEDEGGTAAAAGYDAVVLSVGLGPAASGAEIAKLFGLERDEFGFMAGAAPGIIAAGTCREPQGIVESIADARAAAFDMLTALSPSGSAAPRSPGVLVVGRGSAGMETARRISELGYAVTIIARPGGVEDAGLPPGAEMLSGADLCALDGAVGSFRAVLRGPEGEHERTFGAVVLASGLSDPVKTPYAAGGVVPLEGLVDRLSRLRGRERPRSVAILLDYEIEETTADSEAAFRACIEIRDRMDLPAAILLREARVSARGMERLYDEARAAGACVVAFAGDPRIEVQDGDALIRFHDAVFGEQIAMRFGLLAVSERGIYAAADGGLAETAGIGMDPMGRFQENNIHLLPDLTGRPGVFVVGSCRGETRPAAIVRDAKNAALDVRLCLSKKPRARTRAHPVVDGDLCALCLTCVRSCPARAMRILAEEKRADCIVEACVNCGTCIGECPAGAISIPAWPAKAVVGAI